MKTKPISPIGDDWYDFRKELFTPEEIAECDIKIALLGEIINARQGNGLTQKGLEKISGVKQPVIARMEKGTTDPQLSTIIKILAPLGKTLAIVPLEQKRS
jgi:DNA-binding XRE family transcriptional regulator